MRKYSILIALVLFSSSLAMGQHLKSERDSVLYSLGVMISENLKAENVGSVDVLAVTRAVEDVLVLNRSLMSLEDAKKVYKKYSEKIIAQQNKNNMISGQAFLEENKKRPEVVTLPSGLQYEILQSGEGASPGPADKVTTHYHGTLIDGTVFDSSVQRGEPISFPVNGVIPGWVEALQLMKVGDKWKLYIPHDLAYGANGAGNIIKPYSTLVFEVELLGINQ